MAQITDQAVLDALLSDPEGDRWNASGPLGKPWVVNYSFPDQVPEYFGSDQTTDFAPLSADARELVREGLDAWSDATGLRFVEYDADNGARAGEISFAMDQDLDATQGFSGFAYYPTVSSFGPSPIAGDVFFDPKMFDGSYSVETTTETILHEIGHAIGLKHPFDGSATLPSEFDNTDYTVMSYTNVGGAKTTPQEFDLLAARHLYGDASDRTVGGNFVGREADGTPIYAGTAAGDDMAGYNGDSVFYGNAGDDAISGGGGDDFLQGNTGRDTLTDSSGNDVLRGGADSDTIRARGPGDKLILGDKGNDEIDAAGSSLHIEGGNFRSTGDPLNDQDTITADSDGDDYIQANFGRDTVVVRGAGRDRIHGGKDGDRIDVSEATGRNDLYGDKGNDVLILGDGLDVVHYRPDDGDDRIRGFDPDEDVFSPERGAAIAETTATPDGAEVTMDNGGRLTFFGVSADDLDDSFLV